MGEDQPEDHVTKLKKLAQAELGSLGRAELKLLRAVPEGVAAWCGPNHDNADPDNNPARANDSQHGWGPERHIHAELIRWICADRRARDLVDPVGIGIYGAKIIGELILDYISVPFPIKLLHCAFVDDASFYSGEIVELDFGGSRLKSFIADETRVKGNVFLRDGFWAEGEVGLRGTQIEGSLDCAGGTFINLPNRALQGTGVALSASGMVVNGSVFLRNKFRAKGEVSLLNAQIGGSLDCSGGLFTNPPGGGSGDALSVHLGTIKGTVFLTEGFRAEGATRLVGTQIGGNLECDGGEFLNPPGNLPASGAALVADGISIRGNLFLSGKFRAEGEVSLLDAQIGATLGCVGGTFRNPLKAGTNGKGRALSADRVNVKGDVYLSDGFNAEGRVRLPGAHVGGDLHCHRGEFKAAELDLRGASVGSLWDMESSWPGPGNLYLDGFVYGRIADGPSDAQTRLRWLSLQREFTTQPYLQLAKVLREAGDDDGAQQVLIAMEDRRWKTKEDHHWTDPLQRWPLKLTVGYGYDPLRAFWEVLGLSALGWVIYRRSYLAGNMVPVDKEAYDTFHSDSELPDSYVRFSPFVYSLENSLPLVKLGQADKWHPEPNMNIPLPAKRRSTINLRLEYGGTKWLQNSLLSQRWFPAVTSLGNRVNRCLICIGLQSDPHSEGSPTRLSHWGTSPRFLRWFLWIQIILGWLLATLFLAGISGIVRKN
jgi:hypothetical protein